MDLFILIFVFMAAWASVYFIGKSLVKEEPRFTLEQSGQKTGPSLGPRQILSGLATVIKPAERFLPAANIKKRLIWAGAPLTPLEFFAFKLVTLILIPVAGYIISKKSDPIYLGIFVAVGYIIPDFWLRNKIKARQRQISRDLPSVIDLLTLCVGAGLNFMLAIDRVVKDFKKCPLTEELSLAWQEIQMGRTRQEALKSFADRIGMAETFSFVRTLVQADRMGSPMGDALKIQADEVRMRRFLRGEEMALKAPIKLLVPLLFFILPVVLIVVGGPVILQFMKGGGINF